MLKVNDRVKHCCFGDGTILDVQDGNYIIQFDSLETVRTIRSDFDGLARIAPKMGALSRSEYFDAMEKYLHSIQILVIDTMKELKECRENLDIGFLGAEITDVQEKKLEKLESATTIIFSALRELVC